MKAEASAITDLVLTYLKNRTYTSPAMIMICNANIMSAASIITFAALLRVALGAILLRK